MSELVRLGFVDVPRGVLAVVDADTVQGLRNYRRGILIEEYDLWKGTGDYPSQRVEVEDLDFPHSKSEAVAFPVQKGARYRVEVEIERTPPRVLRFTLVNCEDP